jgi:DNA modification methylase
LAPQSVNMILASPPYWPSKRLYGGFSTIGHEKTVEEYIANVVAVLHECYRVLRDDGSLWLNLADTYVKGDLQHIPERIAIELARRDGWITRAKIIWHKIACRPESVTNRPTTDYANITLTPIPLGFRRRFRLGALILLVNGLSARNPVTGPVDFGQILWAAMWAWCGRSRHR